MRNLSLLQLPLFLVASFAARVPEGGTRVTMRHQSDTPYENQDYLTEPRHNIRKRKAIEAVQDSKYWNHQMQAELRSQLEKTPIVRKAKNVILFLGDGTSISTLTAARLLKGYRSGNFEEEVMAYETFPYSTLIKTYSADKMVTESAASATAYLTGVKGNQETLGVDANVRLSDCRAMNVPEYHTTSVMHNFQVDNRSTGIVTVTRVTHASPAGNFAHTAFRDWESDDDINDLGEDSELCDDIAEQMVLGETGSRIKVILGGGRKKFTPKGVRDPEGGEGGRRDDGKDLIHTWLRQKQHLGNASYVWHRDQLVNLDPDNTDYLLGLFDWSHMSYVVDQDASNPSLEEMTRVALQILQKDDNGFFLFVEGGNIDKAHHLNEPRSALEEALEFERAISLADAMTDPQETLILVTADHSQPFVINGYQDRRSDVLGIADFSDVDGLPYTTLLYTNGPGYRGEYHGSRPDPLDDPISDPHYVAASTVPLLESKHAGEDVVLYARGPFAHLFTGIHENTYIPHAIRYAACVGDGLHYCTSDEELQQEQLLPSKKLPSET